MADHHHLEATPETVHWGYWDASIEPVLEVRSGDRVTVDSVSGARSDLPPDGAGVRPNHRQIVEALSPILGPHCLTGPIWVDGAEPGDTLEVRILDVQLADSWGYNIIRVLAGTLPEEFPFSRCVRYGIDTTAKTARMPWGVDLPLRPFFGNFGVAPRPEYGRISSKEPREHGGNMDNKELIPGTTVYFPVWTQGALFSAGDGHAAQGDGEVCQTALETGVIGTFELIVRKGLRVRFPRAESGTHYISMGMNTDLDDAATQAVREMVDWITELANLSREDAYRLCSLAADLRVTQIEDGNKGIHCMLPKSLL
ncbi:MAG: acetamidase/formamidase family protein [Geminicoccales bacterium]